MKIMEDCAQHANAIARYAEGSLNVAERRHLEGHLRGCPECREGVKRFRAVSGLLQGTIGSERINPKFGEETGRRLNAVARSQPVDDYYEEDEEEVETPLPAPVSFLDSLQERMGAAPWWFISGTFHALMLLLVTLIGMALVNNLREDTVIVTELEEVKEPEEIKEPVTRDIVPKPIPVEPTEVESDQPQIVTHEEVEIADHVETPDDSDAAETQGEDGISDTMLGGSGSVAAMGLGGGGGGAFGRPGGAGGRLRRAVQGGGGKKTESAVDAALDWLARHQEGDGRWNCLKYLENSKRGKYSAHYDPGVTALSVLAFLGAGHTDKIGKYKGVVKKAMDYLVSIQAADGMFGPRQPSTKVWGFMYNHTICALAMAEGSGMCRNPRYSAAAQKGIDFLLSMRGPHGVWDYKGASPRFDTSVSGWAGMALKSAKIAGLKVPKEAFLKIRKWLGTDDQDEAYQDPTVVYSNIKIMPNRKGPAMTAISMLMAMYTGTDGEAPSMQKGGQILLTAQPNWAMNAGSKGIPGINAAYTHPAFNNEYTWYYGTLVMFQVGGNSWKQWNNSLKTALIPSQRMGGPKDGSLADKDGSWDPVNGWAATLGGRVYMTAVCALSLEVYYRYLPLYRK